jgi:hypothetical protein
MSLIPYITGHEFYEFSRISASPFVKIRKIRVKLRKTIIKNEPAAC